MDRISAYSVWWGLARYTGDPLLVVGYRYLSRRDEVVGVHTSTLKEVAGR